ncbi:MAG: hypothetical protein J5965_11365, partial [Aeriscardovia sp.]|nr:hypothetical protein [Aeriscardovia sp.]
AIVATTAYQLAPSNSQIMLYASPENSATMFMQQWNVKNKISAIPVTDITTFRPIDELNNHIEILN